MGDPTGPGKTDLTQAGRHAETIFDVDAHVFNFDINEATLKPEHEKFLREQVLPMLKANPDARVTLIGSASRSGPEANNLTLSQRREEAVLKILGPVASQISDGSFGRGAPKTPGPKEDERDRSVLITMNFPTKTTVEFRTDDWSRPLNWDDIVGFGAFPGGKLARLNIQVTIHGMPSAGAPDEFSMTAVGGRDAVTVPRQKWTFPRAPDSAQPADESKTFYRVSDEPTALGFLPKSGVKGTAVVNRASVPINFSVNDANWLERGRGELGGSSSEAHDLIDAQRLMRAGGVEEITLEGRFDRCRCFARRPATVFFYSGAAGAGESARCLSLVGECSISPEELVTQWKARFNVEVLILAAPNVLQAIFVGGVAAGGPGVAWAKLLARGANPGPLTAILGYDDDAPSAGVLQDIADSMAQRIKSGLSGDQYADAWMDINAAHSGKNTWNAVAMDRRGYFWIEAKNPIFTDKEFYTKPFGGHKPVIQGPATIL